MRSLEKQVEKVLDTGAVQLQSVSGGDINDAYKVISEEGAFFLKWNHLPYSTNMFRAEAAGLEALRKCDPFRAPKSIGVFSDNSGAGLLMEWIEPGRANSDSWAQFAHMLASLHLEKEQSFGFDTDNFIGHLRQANPEMDHWLDFYYSQRIVPQLKMAIDEGLIPGKYHKINETMFRVIASDYPEVSPSMLHGDLWNGNLMFTRQGKPVLIDPAVYFGYREMDLAMMKLFGGFEKALDLYDEILTPDQGREDRLRFHQLYYLLVHANLFGASYASSCRNILDLYGSRTR